MNKIVYHIVLYSCLLCMMCAVPVSDDIRYSELESIWQLLRAYSIYQSSIPEDPFTFEGPEELMREIPDTINDSENYTKYGIDTFAAKDRYARGQRVRSGMATVVVDTPTDSTVFIKFNTFDYATVADEFIDLLPSIEKYPFLVIDLRENTGGYIDQVRPVIDAFLPKAVSYLHVREREYDQDTRTAETVDHYWKTEHGSHYALANKKVSILMDGWSASASEIMIVALKERFDAVLVGDTTYGKGFGQLEIDRRGRPGIKITCMQFSGIEKIDAYHRTGIAPDVYIGSSTQNDTMAVLAAVKVHEPAITISSLTMPYFLLDQRFLRKVSRLPVDVGERYIQVAE